MIKINEKDVGLVSYAVQSKGPVPSGLMLEGSAHLAGALVEKGYSPSIFDFNNTDTIRRIATDGKPAFLQWTIDYLDEHIQKTKTKLLGFTLYTNGFLDNIKIASELKRRNPSLITAAGGPLVGWVEEEILKFTDEMGVDAFDLLVYGEGNGAIQKLASAVYNNESMSDVPGAIYKNRTGEIIKNKRHGGDIITLPTPIYDKDVYHFFDYKIPVSTLRTSIGCRWAKCTFCVQPRIDGVYRERNIEEVIRETEYLDKEYSIKNFRLSDPNPRPDHLKRLLEEMHDDHRISCFAYSDQDYDFESVGKKLIAVFIGAESTNPNVLKSLGKTNSPYLYMEQYREMITEAKRNGVATIFANIVPLANDTSKNIREHLQRVIEINPDFITATPLGPLPRTILYRKAVKEGRKSGFILDNDYLKKLMLWELDLLADPETWDPPPWQVNVNGEFVKNPMDVTGKEFVWPLKQHNIMQASDEIVLMADMYYGGLSKDQAKKREEVSKFQNLMRAATVQGEYGNLEQILHRMKHPTKPSLMIA